MCTLTLPLQLLLAATFVSFLLEVDSIYEVHDYVKSYLGETGEAHEFAKQFLERRQKLKPPSTSQQSQVRSQWQVCWMNLFILYLSPSTLYLSLSLSLNLPSSLSLSPPPSLSLSLFFLPPSHSQGNPVPETEHSVQVESKTPPQIAVGQIQLITACLEGVEPAPLVLVVEVQRPTRRRRKRCRRSILPPCWGSPWMLRIVRTWEKFRASRIHAS